MRATWVPAMLLVVFLSACGGGGDGAGADECADPVAVSSVEITGKGSGYEPDCLSVDAGATITLDNSDHMPHTFTVDGTDVNYNVGAGDSIEADLSSLEPSLYDVTCVFHPSMQATLTVE
jgi:plastocyanin